MSSRSVYVAAEDGVLCISKAGCRSSVGGYRSCRVPSSADGPRACSHMLAAASNAPGTTGVLISLYNPDYSSSA